MAQQTILKNTHKHSEALQRQQFPSHIISECLGLLNSQLQETRACYFSQKLFQIFFNFMQKSSDSDYMVLGSV